MAKQYIYIVQASMEPASCKIGKTNDLERRLREYNGITGKSKENIYRYLFACEVKDIAKVENAIKEEFSIQRQEKSKEIYFYNIPLFESYVRFIKEHELFLKEIFVRKEEKAVVKIVKKTKPSLEERGITRRDVIQKAQKADNDEFYTMYEDIEKELSMYDKSIWKNKVVFCNCDDAVGDDEKRTSAFALYFLQHFKEFGLKKLICTHYGNAVDLFNQGAKGYIFTKDGFKELREYPKGYTGSFDDPLSIKILNQETDIVCTNPPFSRAVEYWKILIESGKRFLIISNYINPIATAFIPYFRDSKAWAGYNRVRRFLDIKKQIVEAPAHWYTNIPIKNRTKYKNLKIVPLKEIPDKYKRYDDNGILNLYNSYIPNDYKEKFAVSTDPILNGVLEKGYKIACDKEYTPYMKGKRNFKRVLVQKA